MLIHTVFSAYVDCKKKKIMFTLRKNNKSTVTVTIFVTVFDLPIPAGQFFSCRPLAFKWIIWIGQVFWTIRLDIWICLLLTFITLTLTQNEIMFPFFKLSLQQIFFHTPASGLLISFPRFDFHASCQYHFYEETRYIHVISNKHAVLG